ncbi:TetR/AcrR family transcriptional regulator [Catellatospora citrea]|uniref:TetR family transcriptional regulator n=1 Tax=Catellatospora citrea TaxID=53366 RepID=A0A8J3KDL6_9ACTN|nr:TetR/AcrR family transcriptional regulator [Catellatospora citrea]RKE06372.1 TetR family transcriptional regulator [Catellatospora citrea]GIG00998.1 TetR family transcriptional regulator [Catellatospora citrea]
MATTALRADAERNRRRLIDAALAVFSERGLDAPLDEIARTAGVGNATLYRHFPARRDLIAAVYAETLAEIVTAAERAAAHPDAWTGFHDHLVYLCGVQSRCRATSDLLTAAVAGVPGLDALHERAYHGLQRLIERAQAAGALRADFRHEDVVLILMANAGLIERTAEAAPEAWRRQLAYTLDGLRAPGRTPAPPSPGVDRVVDAMRERGRRFSGETAQ